MSSSARSLRLAPSSCRMLSAKPQARTPIKSLANLRLSPLSRALQTMPPYSVALCAVRRGSSLGFAASDPYLSCASPLTVLPVLGGGLDVHEALRTAVGMLEEERSLKAGVLVLAPPMLLRDDGADSEAEAARRARDNLVHDTISVSPSRNDYHAVCVREELLSLETARRQLSGPLADLWEQVGELSSAAAADVHAAAVLQDVLDEEMGGWPNTFG